MNKEIEKNLRAMFERWAGEAVKSFKPLEAHGSDRKYFRIKGKTKRAIGAFNPDMKENVAFLTFSKHFKSLGLNVPEIYSQELDKNIYLEEDLGDTTLFSFLSEKRAKEGFSPEVV